MTGWIKSIQSGVDGGTGVQNLEYAWDQAGNLSSRKDKNQANLTESFVYDNLYRLKSATLSTGPGLTYDYDALGNLTNKSDVGAYVYHATKKHQVVSTGAPTNFSFGYDANGNMTSGRGATIDWTSYNYPSCIRLGAACTGSTADYSSFSYTPDRQYWRQISNYTSGGTATTLYIGGLLEKVTTSSGTDYRHYIRAGGSTIIVSRQSTGTNSINYVTSDQLGSSSAITNSSGGILVNSSFDAFGKRRGSNWTGSPSAGDWTAIASTTRRGFTEHTMLDNLNLTHMNGRVYDQVVGRFLSADPYIDGALNTQGWNRFSYVQNNPLSYTDPSGFRGGWIPHENGWPTDYVDTTSPRWTDFTPGMTVSSATYPADRGTPDGGGKPPSNNPTSPNPINNATSVAAWEGVVLCDFQPSGCPGSWDEFDDWVSSNLTVADYGSLFMTGTINRPAWNLSPDGSFALYAGTQSFAAGLDPLATAGMNRIQAGLEVMSTAASFGIPMEGVVFAIARSTLRFTARGAEALRPTLVRTNPRNLIPTQTRAEMSGSQVRRLAKDMKQNGFDQSQAVDAWRNPLGRLEIQDGHHRTEAAIQAGLDEIPVLVWP